SRDKQMIATLEERLAQEDNTISTLQSRLRGMESDQTMIRESSLPAEKERDMLERIRQEMSQLIEHSEARRLNAEREAERRLELNREGITRTIRNLEEKLDQVQRSTGSITEVKSEGSRVADSMFVLQQRVDDLTKQLEEPDRRLAFLEEQRRQDSRRLSEIESELPEIRKQIDGIRPKVTLIEDLSIRNERKLQDVQNSERERREQIQQFVDQQNLVAQQRDQKIDSLLKHFNEHEEAMQQNMERFETWATAYRDMKRVISDFERIGDRLERRINEVAEMQRLSEERFRQEWNDWRDDDQRRWKQMTLANDDVWRNHDKEFQEYVQKLDQLIASITPLQDSLQRMWKLERDRAQMYRDRYQELLLEYDQPASTAPSTATSTGSMPAILDFDSDGGSSNNGSY
ncbi:MAG: hypothetical protein KC496_20395, partial [Anaerolineae bacterium]|nr:hypothetical protein [Anaerolineae bacterium]